MTARTRSLAALLFFLPLDSRANEVPEPADYWTGPVESPVPATIAGGKVIRARELAGLLARERVVVVDSSNAPKRPAELAPGAPWLPLPQQVIPGSIWIPGAGMGVIPDEIDRLFRERLAQATHGDFEYPIVVYCHERCWLSWNAAKRAIGYGYRRVYWLPEGIEGWRAAGFRTVPADAEEPGSGY